MSTLATPTPPPIGWLEWIGQGFRARPWMLALILAINTGIALILWQNDDRPFWHPLVTVQIHGLCIAYAVNAVKPWLRPHPLLSMVGAIVVASLVAVVLVMLVKGYTIDRVVLRWHSFAWNVGLAIFNGLLISLLFHVKFSEARASAALHRAEAERNLLARQAVEAELKLMQAQVEPHFLFNTLSSVQYLTEHDPQKAGTLLGHLIEYLRAALPQLRAQSSTLGREFELANAYLAILEMRIGPRLQYELVLPPELATHPFPPNMLISLVENAIKHGIEPAAEGGRVTVRAARDGDNLVLEVTDSGLAAEAGRAHTRGDGVGLSNVRERLAALFGARGRFLLVDVSPHGKRATITVPHAP